MSIEAEMPQEIACSPHPDIHIRGPRLEDGTMTIVLEGQIRYQSVASLQEFLIAQLTEHVPNSLVLDLEHITFLDSQGLAFLISLYKYCLPQGCSLAIRNAPAHVQNLVKLTRLNAFITLL